MKAEFNIGDEVVAVDINMSYNYMDIYKGKVSSVRRQTNHVSKEFIVYQLEGVVRTFSESCVAKDKQSLRKKLNKKLDEVLK